MKILILNVPKIESERARLGLTYTALAAKCEISKQRLWSMLRRGVTSFEGVGLLGHGLNMDPKDLVMSVDNEVKRGHKCTSMEEYWVKMKKGRRGRE